MLQQDWLVLIGLGSLFIILGLGAIFWDRSEQKGYYNSTATRGDVREYLEHWPPRPQFGALKIGGWIAIAIGIVLIAMGGGLLLWK